MREPLSAGPDPATAYADDAVDFADHAVGVNADSGADNAAVPPNLATAPAAPTAPTWVWPSAPDREPIRSFAAPPALVGQEADVPPASRPLRAYLLPVRLGQVLAWQVAVLAVLATLRPFGARSAVVLALAVLTVLATSVRVGGLCGYEWLAVRWRFRSASTPAEAADALHAVVPGLTIRTHTDRGGTSVGLAGVGDGWSAVLQLDSPSGAQTAALIPLLLEACQNRDVPLDSAQLLVRTDRTPYEPRRTGWLAIRYRAADAPHAAEARGGGELGAMRATVAAALALARRFEDVGHPATVLDATALHEHLLTALGADDPQSAPTVAWDGCAFGAVWQSCFRPSRGTSAPPRLVRPGAGRGFTCTSYLVRRTPRGQLCTDVVVRFGGERHTRRSAAETLGVALDRLDGRHLAYVRATLPLALVPDSAGGVVQPDDRRRDG